MLNLPWIQVHHSRTSAVVLKWVPLGSRREEFKFVGGIGGEAVDEKTLTINYLFIQHIKNAQRGCTHGQAALTAVTDVIIEPAW